MLVGFAASGVKNMFGKKAASKTIIEKLRSYAGRVVSNPVREAKLATGKTARALKSDTAKTGYVGGAMTGVFTMQENNQ